MTAPVHDLYAVTIGDDLLGGITAQQIPPNPVVVQDQSSGNVDIEFVALRAQSPMFGFTTLSVGKALAICGIDGYNIASETGLVQYAQAHDDGGTRKGATSHNSYAAAQGLLVPRTLTVENQGDAQITYEGMITWDGTANLPVVKTENVTLPTNASQADDERFTLGPTTLGGVTFEAKQSMTIDFGLGVVAQSADSDIWPTFSSIRRRNIVITWNGIDPNWWDEDSAVGLEGLLAPQPQTEFYLRARKLGGTFVDDSTGEHVKFVTQGLIQVTEGLGGTTNEPQVTSMQLTAYRDAAGNAPLVITPDSMIT